MANSEKPVYWGATSAMGHVWTAPCGQALFGVATIAVGCSHVSGLFVQPSSRPLALMWFARRVQITSLGSRPLTHGWFSLLDDRPIDIMPSAPPQP